MKTALILSLSLLITFRANAKTDPRINGIIELSVQENFDAALEIIAELEVEHPHDPAPHFFRASVLQSMMMDYETNRWQQDFFNEIATAITLSDALLHVNGDDAQALLFRGAALSYKGLHLARNKNYLGGIHLSIQGIRTLESALAKDGALVDAYLVVGSYKYWRSYLTRNFSWLPFFHDQRREGIELIVKAYCEGSFAKWAALSNLGWIFIQEERFEEAIRCAEEGLSAFPHSRFFLWLLAEALFRDQQHARAAEVYQTLLESVVAEEINNRYNEILLHLKLAQCFHAVHKAEQSAYHARRVLEIVPDVEVEERTREKKQAAAKLLREIRVVKSIR